MCGRRPSRRATSASDGAAGRRAAPGRPRGEAAPPAAGCGVTAGAVARSHRRPPPASRTRRRCGPVWTPASRQAAATAPRRGDHGGIDPQRGRPARRASRRAARATAGAGGGADARPPLAAPVEPRERRQRRATVAWRRRRGLGAGAAAVATGTEERAPGRVQAQGRPAVRGGAGGQERQRVEVPLRLRGQPDAQMDVRLARPRGRRSARSCRPGRPRRPVRPSVDGDRAQMGERHRIPVRCLDRDALPRGRDRPGEGHRSRGRSEDRRSCLTADVDAPVLAALVRAEPGRS